MAKCEDCKKEKKILCPECGADLKKVGAISRETAYVNYDWKWNKRKNYFVSKEESIDGGDLEGMFCRECEKEIDADLITNS